jgi:hypothetical protein
MDYIYSLDPSSRKHICPACGKKRFVRYISTVTGEYVDEAYGRCDRAQNCNYHALPPKSTATYCVPFEEIISYSDKSYRIKYNDKLFLIPKSQILELNDNHAYVSAYFLAKTDNTPYYITHDVKHFFEDGTFRKGATKPMAAPAPPSYIDEAWLDKSLKNNASNSLLLFLSKHIDNSLLNEAFNKYKIGTSSNGSTIFWQIDNKSNIHSGKLIKYGNDGHRIKNISPSWVHKKLNLQNFNLNQCLFGLHLIDTDPVKSICIVEAEKTALIASIYFPDFIWLATGGLYNLKEATLMPIKNRHIILWPDLSVFEKWSEIASAIKNNGFDITVSDFLESKASDTDKIKGLDLADYLLQFPINTNQNSQQNENHEKSEISLNNYLFELDIEPHPLNVDWFRDLNRFDPAIIIHEAEHDHAIHDFIRHHVKMVKESQNIESYNKLTELQEIILFSNN